MNAQQRRRLRRTPLQEQYARRQAALVRAQAVAEAINKRLSNGRKEDIRIVKIKNDAEEASLIEEDEFVFDLSEIKRDQAEFDELEKEAELRQKIKLLESEVRRKMSS